MRTVRAQALPTATGPGAYVIVGGAYSRFQADYGSQAINGAAVYVDSNLIWRYGAETEARRVVYPSFGMRQSTLLAGPRWSLRSKGFVPYVKLLAGGGRFEFPYGYGHSIENSRSTRRPTNRLRRYEIARHNLPFLI